MKDSPPVSSEHAVRRNKQNEDQDGTENHALSFCRRQIQGDQSKKGRAENRPEEGRSAPDDSRLMILIETCIVRESGPI